MRNNLYKRIFLNRNQIRCRMKAKKTDNTKTEKIDNNAIDGDMLKNNLLLDIERTLLK